MTPSSSVLGVQVPARCHTLAGIRRGTRFPSGGEPSPLSPRFTLSFHLWILWIPQSSDCDVYLYFLGSRPRLYRKSDEPIRPTWTWHLQHKGSGSLSGNVAFTVSLGVIWKVPSHTVLNVVFSTPVCHLLQQHPRRTNSGVFCPEENKEWYLRVPKASQGSAAIHR